MPDSSPSWFTGLRRDVEGGVVSALIAIPLSVAFGMFAFVSLGDEYFAHGAIAGFVASCAAGVVGILFGGRANITIYAPRITTTFFLGALLYGLAHVEGTPAPVAVTLLVLFAVVALGGAFQAMFGLFQLGTLIKFTPHPVTAGFQNMAAALLFLVQLGNVFGFGHNVKFTQVHLHLAETRPLTLLVAAVTFAAMWNASRLTKHIAPRIPPLLFGLLVGTALYYALVAAGFGALLGPVIGLPSASVSVPKLIFGLQDKDTLTAIWGFAPVIGPAALALALIAAIDALLCAKLAGTPGDSNRLLIKLGLANIASGAAGGITSSINIGATVANRAFGAHSWVSIAVNAALQLAVILALFRYVSYLPRVVLSATIMVVAIQHLDPWSKTAAAQLLRSPKARWKSLGLDLLVALIVSVLSIAINIVLAVFVGVALAVALFVLRMSRSNVRRIYRGDVVRSRKARGAAELAALETKGAGVLVLELQGALFFGSAEILAQVVAAEAARAQTTAVILDLRRVTEIDSTGARIIADTEATLAKSGCKLALVVRGEVADEIDDAVTKRFADVDRAIEWAEDEVLGGGAADQAAELALPGVSLLRDFTADQLERLKPYLVRAEWKAGSVIVAQGDPGTQLFLVTRGRASVRLASASGPIRLATFAPGSVFGELALLDRGPRSATVTADDEVVTWSLNAKSFEALQRAEPDLAIAILAALGRELSGRLRQANRTIHQLES